MAIEKLGEFVAYHKALRLFDLVVEDMASLGREMDSMRIRSQQLAAADSICANMEEGAIQSLKRRTVQTQEQLSG